MSARLLNAKGPTLHERADDLESFFLVLSWMAMCYTSHGLNSKELGAKLERVFEDVFHDGQVPWGGSAKKSFILEDQIGQEIGLLNKKLRSLLRKVGAVMAVRYMSYPQSDDPDEDLFPELRPGEEYRQTYQFMTDSLHDPQWMLKTFEEALKDRNAWPALDEAKANSVAHTPSQSRRDKSSQGSKKRRHF
jgi:hypothetical protein